MLRVLDEYNQRLSERDIRVYDATILNDIEQNNPKFESNGHAKPFYGSTCITWIEQQSKLFQTLSVLQRTLQQKFQQADLSDIFTFLPPESFHMTICDIDACSDVSRIQFQSRVEQVQRACQQIGSPGYVNVQLRGIGLKTTIAILVKFQTEDELKKVLDIEHKIKAATNVNVRHFTGHITFAYFVQHPGECLQTIKDILLPYHNAPLGEYTFSQFDLTVFTDITRFIPILTMNLIDGEIAHHKNGIKLLKSIWR